MIVVLIFRILALFRILPFRLMLRELIGQPIRQHPSERQVVSRVVAFAITIGKSIAELQIHSIRQRLAITYFSTHRIVVGRCRYIATDSILIHHDSIPIITSHVVGIAFTFIVAITTDGTQSEVASTIVQPTGQLHIHIGRQGLAFRHGSIVGSIDTNRIQCCTHIPIKIKEIIRIGYYRIRVGIERTRLRTRLAVCLSPRETTSHKESGQRIRSPFQADITFPISILVAVIVVRIGKRAVSIGQEVFHLSHTDSIVILILMKDTTADFKVLRFRSKADTRFLGCCQSIVLSPTWTTSTTKTIVVHIVQLTKNSQLKAIVAMTGKTADTCIGRISVFGSSSGIQVSNPTLVHPLLDGQVQHHFFFTIVDTCNTGIIGLSFIRIDFFNHADRQILQTRLHITAKEFLAINQNPLDLLTIHLYITIVVHLGTRKFLHQFFQHGTFRRTISCRIISQSIARYRHLCRFGSNHGFSQQDSIGSQRDFTQIQGRLGCGKLELFGISKVTNKRNLQYILSRTGRQAELPVKIRSLSGHHTTVWQRQQLNRCRRNRRVIPLVQHDTRHRHSALPTALGKHGHHTKDHQQCKKYNLLHFLTINILFVLFSTLRYIGHFYCPKV